jgi:hypothetical protein
MDLFDLPEPKSKLSRDDYDEWFETTFWPAYPQRFGHNPKKPARDRLFLKIKSGENPDKILTGVRRFAVECGRTRITGTCYVPRAITWINGHGWADDPLPPGDGNGKAQSDNSKIGFSGFAAILRQRIRDEEAREAPEDLQPINGR